MHSSGLLLFLLVFGFIVESRTDSFLRLHHIKCNTVGGASS